MSEPRFKAGDEVMWTSQSQGYRAKKEGMIVAVVPAFASPNLCLPSGYSPNSSAGYGSRRDHESYLVQVGRSKRLYWPRVSALKSRVSELAALQSRLQAAETKMAGLADCINQELRENGPADVLQVELDDDFRGAIRLLVDLVRSRATPTPEVSDASRG